MSIKIVKNIISLVLSNMITKIANAFVIIFITRLLGDEAFGQFSYAFSLTILLSVLIDLGINNYLIREIAKDKNNNELVPAAIKSKLILTIVYIFIMYLVISFKKTSIITKQSIILFSISVILNSYSMLGISILRAYQNMKYEAFINTVERVSLLIFCLVAWYLQFNLFKIIQGYILVAIIKLILTILILVCKVRLKFSSNYNYWLLIKKSIPFGLTAVLGMIYFRIDIIMLENFVSKQEVGWYSSAMRLIEALMILPEIVSSVLYPYFSELFTSNNEKIIYVFKFILKIFFYISFPMCIGGSILSEKLIIFMYGRDFIGSIDALKILIWTLLFIFTNYILGMTLNSINKQNINTINTLICVIVNIVLNSILIPLVGYIGAAIATVFTEATLTFLGIINLKKVLKDIKIVEKSLIRTIFAAIVMGLVVLIMQNYINVIVNIVVGSIIYILFLGLLRELRKEDIYTIASIIRGKFYE